MLASLCRYLKPIVYKSNSTIIRAHTLGTRMFFMQVSACPCLCCQPAACRIAFCHVCVCRDLRGALPLRDTLAERPRVAP